ncbi:alpha/beta-hydrolase [Nadsonia fulvescens var. elongata DSM 6958]|uniref:Alpha/beta-hydrolase n=1 Tax=Nadsonia fulvescens var. elongata DSM 6958 TaxID=857566 RepID=A0A1E3PIV6_9ASCO|nr:alpha/beta-hydrolase [Nadsonia fulvescens var. elongata DSM 6958]
MLIKESYVDIKTSLDTTMRVFIYHPSIPGYPHAKFPGVVVYSEIYQVTGPVARFARDIASRGYIVAAPSIYHNFAGPEAFDYDTVGTDKGNAYKIEKPLESYDEDNKLTVDLLMALPTCTGKIGATGMCLGGHLAYRAGFDARVSAVVCFFATDIHLKSLGAGKNDDSLIRTARGEFGGPANTELLMIFGTRDPHVSPEGRDLIRKTLRDADVFFSFYEYAGAQHAFIRDENSKGRYDSAVTAVCVTGLFELFDRVLKLDLGLADSGEVQIDNVC